MGIKLKDYGDGHKGFHCPGCGYDHAFVVDNPKYKHNWKWNGSLDKPTFHPSLLCNQNETKIRCHSWVENGKIKFLQDCWHNLRGQTVDLPDRDDSQAITKQSELKENPVHNVSEENFTMIEYPRWRHDGNRSVLCRTYEEEQALGEGWYDSPSVAWRVKAQKSAEETLKAKESPVTSEKIEVVVDEKAKEITVDVTEVKAKAASVLIPQQNERKFDRNYNRGRNR